jgi:hypothetical protein
MSSDDTKPRQEPGFRGAGPGMSYTFRCGQCGMPIPNFGRRKQRVKGALVWVGKCCFQKTQAPEVSA